MNLIYADQKGNVYDHPQHVALGSSGDMIVELLEDELIPLPEGATMVSLPFTRPVYMDSETSHMLPYSDEYTAVGALLPQGYTRLLLPAYVKTDKTKFMPLFGYTAVVWKNGGFYVAAKLTDDPHRWDPNN